MKTKKNKNQTEKNKNKDKMRVNVFSCTPMTLMSSSKLQESRSSLSDPLTVPKLMDFIFQLTVWR